ncbi:hypothetical protein POUND7_008891 [Theobroma cacao]
MIAGHSLTGRTSERRILKSTQHLNFQHISGGYVVISTPDGILDHEEAISRNVVDRFLVIFIRLVCFSALF